MLFYALETRWLYFNAVSKKNPFVKLPKYQKDFFVDKCNGNNSIFLELRVS